MDHCCDEYPASQPSSPPTYKLQNLRLENLVQLMQRYINNEASLEYQCICALQQFAFEREYPSGESIMSRPFDV